MHIDNCLDQRMYLTNATPCQNSVMSRPTSAMLHLIKTMKRLTKVVQKLDPSTPRQSCHTDSMDSVSIFIYIQHLLARNPAIF